MFIKKSTKLNGGNHVFLEKKGSILCGEKMYLVPFSLWAEECFYPSLFLLGCCFLCRLLCFGMFHSARHISSPPLPFYKY